MCKTVTFCGHRDLPDRAAVEAWLRRTLPCLYAQGARRFYVGGYGAFDAAAAAAALSLRAAHPEVEVVLVRPYLDAGPAPQPSMASVYPPLERVPRRFAIARRNRWMVDQADVVVACTPWFFNDLMMQLCEAEKQGKPIFYYFPPEEDPCAP